MWKDAVPAFVSMSVPWDKCKEMKGKSQLVLKSESKPGISWVWSISAKLETEFCLQQSEIFIIGGEQVDSWSSV
jgi:hypothetical protein